VLDQVNALQELSPQIMDETAHLFSMQPAYQIRTTNLRPHTGDMLFRGENPAPAALIDYWVKTADTPITVTIRDSAGRTVQQIKGSSKRGINRVSWNLRYADLSIRSGGGEDDDEGPRATTPGPLVLPGRYTVRLEYGATGVQKQVVVREDPRLTVSRAERAAWTAFHRDIAALATSFVEVQTRWRAKTGTDSATIDRKRQANELGARLSTLYSAVGRWTGAPTADQRTQLRYYKRMAGELDQISVK
jgi:hypothetical protein